jgi:hypothetical protein
MKSHSTHNLAIAAVGAWWLTNIVAPAKALHYRRVAQRDERNGFPYTAAMEWRKAAELFGSKTRAAEYCWRQWERMMHLPRRLAGPIGVCQVTAFPSQSASGSRPAIGPAIDQISFANAA